MKTKQHWMRFVLVAISLAGSLLLLSSAMASGAGSRDRMSPLAVFDPALSLVGAFVPGAVGVPGEQVVWTITVVNTGDAPGTDILITDTLNENLRLDYVSTDRGSYAVNRQIVVLDLSTLNPGETAQMQLVTTVLNNPPDGVLVNQVVLTGQGPAGTVTDRAVTQMSMPTRLPSTGYPPAEDLPGEGEPSVAAVALVACAAVIGTAFIVWRRANDVV